MGGIVSDIGTAIKSSLDPTGGGRSIEQSAENFLDPGHIWSSGSSGMGGGLLGGMMFGSVPGTKQNQELADYAQEQAAPLIAAGESGKLTPDQQAAVSTFKQEGRTQANFQAARMGMGKSTSLVEAQNQVQAQAVNYTNQFLTTDLQEGLAYLGAAEGNMNTVAQLTLQQNALMGEALGNAASTVGNIFGSQPPPDNSGLVSPNDVSYDTTPINGPVEVPPGPILAGGS